MGSTAADWLRGRPIASSALHRPASDARPSVRLAKSTDRAYLIEAFCHALAPYYGGDHSAHASRLIQTHLAGGNDRRGLLSIKQVLYVLWDNNQRHGVLNLVFKRQGTCKISPLILYPNTQDKGGFGETLLKVAKSEARAAGSRQLYCTVAQSNRNALLFFLQNGFVVCGTANSQYKDGETEVLLRHPLDSEPDTQEARSIISVTEVCNDDDWVRIRKLFMRDMTQHVDGADYHWLDSLLAKAQHTRAANSNASAAAWIYCARDRTGAYRAAAVALPKDGGSVKIMPVAAMDADAFRALIIDLPALLDGKGRKAYVHIDPKPHEVASLQESGWVFEAHIPGAYSVNVVTQQWGRPLGRDASLKTLRIHDRYLRQIAGGLKTLEIRVAYPHIRRIRPGDTLCLMSRSESVQCAVNDVRSYPGFAEMLLNEEVDKALPGTSSPAALDQLRAIYPAAKESLGVVVIELKPL